MGITNTPPTPDTDNDTPPHNPPAIRPFSFSNGASKNHHQPPPHAAVTYRECQKNHAANLGGHALDGCGEFMPSHTANPTDPTSLKCAACGCHRNFHRRDYEEYSPFITAVTPHFLDFRHPRRSSSSPSSQPAALPLYAPPQMFLAVSTAAHDDQQVPTHQQQHVATPVTPRNAKDGGNLSGRKRFRTKFSQDQKEKMHSFAEKLGWKIQKCDENLVQNFCSEIGVGRAVLKVWMHNNKHTIGRRELSSTNMINLNPTNMEEENNNVNEEENSGSHCNNESRDASLDLHLDHNITNGASSPS